MRQTTQIILVCGVALLSGWSQVSQQEIKIKNTCSITDTEVINLDISACIKDVSHFNFGFKTADEIYQICHGFNQDLCSK